MLCPFKTEKLLPEKLGSMVEAKTSRISGLWEFEEMGILGWMTWGGVSHK